ncbi:MAG: class I SAM-dependent RNA methyltransferase [Peptostreptococcaceae bacterium]|nr:class I SAM-dependent RNA methyltransferase [Peptostreptococcaceae bacterium]
MKYELIAPCLFGMESTVSYELKNMGIAVTKVTDGRVRFEGDASDIARANIGLRTAERVLIKVGEFRAASFEQLYQGMKALPFERYVRKMDAFPISKAKSVSSKLFSIPDIQSVAKKAVVDRLKVKYRTDIFPERGTEYPITVFLHKDVAEVTIDTSGPALHKRGYRERSGEAPLRETIAAFMVLATPWRPSRPLMDPMCGSGTILIEAAMIGANIMPGVNRNFVGERFSFLPKDVWKSEREEALRAEKDIEFILKGYDMDAQVIELARENAELAGVGHLISFEQRELKDLRTEEEYGFLITNPPYGERLNPQEGMEELYASAREVFSKLRNWSFNIISVHEQLDRELKIPFQKKRKIYNGKLKSHYYQYLGSKPKQ